MQAVTDRAFVAGEKRYNVTVKGIGQAVQYLVQFVDLADTFTEGQTKEEALFLRRRWASALC